MHFRRLRKPPYAGILAAYVKELPYKNVYMGTGYNTMDDIGSFFADVHARDSGFIPDDSARDMAGRAVGFSTYTDFDGHARVLKFKGEMCMEEQREM